MMIPGGLPLVYEPRKSREQLIRSRALIGCGWREFRERGYEGGRRPAVRLKSTRPGARLRAVKEWAAHAFKMNRRMPLSTSDSFATRRSARRRLRPRMRRPLRFCRGLLNSPDCGQRKFLGCRPGPTGAPDSSGPPVRRRPAGELMMIPGGLPLVYEPRTPEKRVDG